MNCKHKGCWTHREYDIVEGAFVGTSDDRADRWYIDHVRRVPHNAIRVLRVAQSVWFVADFMGRWKAVNAKTGRMKLLPKLRNSPVGTNAIARHIMRQATRRNDE